MYMHMQMHRCMYISPLRFNDLGLGFGARVRVWVRVRVRAQLVELGRSARRERADAPPSELERAREGDVGEGGEVEAVGHAQQRRRVPG